MIYIKKHWIYKDVILESHSRIWCIRALNFHWHSGTHSFSPADDSLKKKGKERGRSKQQGEGEMAVPWDKSEKILLPAASPRPCFLKELPSGINEQCPPDEDLSARSWKAQNYLVAFGNTLENLIRLVVK